MGPQLSGRGLNRDRGSSSQIGNGAAVGQGSGQNIPPNMKNRCFSANGNRTLTNFYLLKELEEIEMIKNGLQDYEVKMQEAAEKRMKVKQDQVDYAKTMNDRVVEKLEFKNIQNEELFRQQFEKNYEKRKKIEEKKKKLGEEKDQTYLYYQAKKEDKMLAIKSKQAQNKNIEEKKNKRLEIRWREIKTRQADLSMRQPYALYESMVSKDNINSTNGRKHWIQQMNYQRKMRQQQDYKVLLVDKM